MRLGITQGDNIAMLVNLSMNITYRCNTVCAHCNRGIGVLDWDGVPDMTLDDAERLAHGIEKSEHTVSKIKFMGGEPSLHPQLKELTEIFLPHCKKIWIVTNGTAKSWPKMSDQVFIKKQPLNRKDHYPTFVSPADLGLEPLMIKDINRCRAMTLCGRGVEPEGFTQCSLARTIVTALGRDPTPIFHDEPVVEADYEICKHCPVALGRWGNITMAFRVAMGEIPCPTKSFVKVASGKTLQAADRHIRDQCTLGNVNILPSENKHTVVDKLPPEFEVYKKQQDKIMQCT